MAIAGGKKPYKRFTDQRKPSSGLSSDAAKALLQAAREGRMGAPTRSLALT